MSKAPSIGLKLLTATLRDIGSPSSEILVKLTSLSRIFFACFSN